jgi:hypothetical protein
MINKKIIILKVSYKILQGLYKIGKIKKNF